MRLALCLSGGWLVLVLVGGCNRNQLPQKLFLSKPRCSSYVCLGFYYLLVKVFKVIFLGFKILCGNKMFLIYGQIWSHMFSQSLLNYEFLKLAKPDELVK